ncbi:unnamed protein product [Prunus armeniaca]|uniref:Morc S5 domain-containing protein n=1 Tax=Prunus armeniaca TaxID=36596 RepID=A0A6J5X070_PRUAR|nr:unnamed protein product [Prunus armeniaca]
MVLIICHQDDHNLARVDYEFNSSARTFNPIIPHNEDQFSSNLTMLLQWSPYSTEEELLKQFDDIGDHGTKLVIYNLWLNDDGDMELDFDSDPKDICINGDKALSRMKANQHVANLYQHSLRAYASILYRQLPQYFRIILRGRDVEHHNIASDLKYLQFIKYMPQIHGNMEVEIITAIGFLKEANTHGFNIYHRNRLILPFWRVLRIGTNSTGRGVVGVLEPDYIQPTHNKQDFEKTSLFQKLEDPRNGRGTNSHTRVARGLNQDHLEAHKRPNIPLALFSLFQFLGLGL